MTNQEVGYKEIQYTVLADAYETVEKWAFENAVDVESILWIQTAEPTFDIFVRKPF